MLFGMSPRFSGVYGNNDNWQQNSKLNDKEILLDYLKRVGYRTVNYGKLFHDGGVASRYFNSIQGGKVTKGTERKERF